MRLARHANYQGPGKAEHSLYPCAALQSRLVEASWPKQLPPRELEGLDPALELLHIRAAEACVGTEGPMLVAGDVSVHSGVSFSDGSGDRQ